MHAHLCMPTPMCPSMCVDMRRYHVCSGNRTQVVSVVGEHPTCCPSQGFIAVKRHQVHGNSYFLKSTYLGISYCYDFNHNKANTSEFQGQACADKPSGRVPMWFQSPT